MNRLLQAALAAGAAWGCSGVAAGQVTSEQKCALVSGGASIPAKVAVPEGQALGAEDADAALRIDLVSPDKAEVVATARVEPGDVDLARLFPKIWETATPRTLYAQLYKGETGIGPALVLTPMLPPRYAPRADRDGTPAFPRENANSSKPKTLSGYWINTDRHAVVTTSQGELTFRLRPDIAPNSVMNFRDLIEKGFYKNIPVHRIASLIGQPRADIIQFGDPTGTGLGGPGYMIDLEPTALRHDYGVLSYARTADPNSAGSQLIICLNREGTAALDGRYAAFAQLVAQGPSGDPLGAISKSAVNSEGKPHDPPVIRSIKLVDAPPLGPKGAAPAPLEDPLKRVPAR